MNSWFGQLHSNSTALPLSVTAVKLAIALAIGLLVGFERQWSHKEFGVRTFALTALLGALTAPMSAPAMLMGMAATILFAVLLNVRDIITFKLSRGQLRSRLCAQRIPPFHSTLRYWPPSAAKNPW